MTLDCPSRLQKVRQSVEREFRLSVRLCTGCSLAGSPVSQCRHRRRWRSQAPDAPLAAAGGEGGGRRGGAGLQQSAGGGAVEGLLAAGAEVVEAAGAPARGPLSLDVVRRRRAAAPAAAQRLVLLQVAGSLGGRDTQSS